MISRQAQRAILERMLQLDYDAADVGHAQHIYELNTYTRTPCPVAWNDPDDEIQSPHVCMGNPVTPHVHICVCGRTC